MLDYIKTSHIGRELISKFGQLLSLPLKTQTNHM